jgi:hypothetical protein
MNLIAAYMLHVLAGSQSMGKLSHAFKNVRNMDKFLHDNAAPSDGTQPILTRETMSYAISLSISCVSFHATNDTSKGKASAAYERAMEHFNELDECDWHTLLRDLLIEYVTLLTNPDSWTMSTRPAPARTAPAPAAPAPAEGEGEGGGAGGAATPAPAAGGGGGVGGASAGDGGGDGDGDGDGDKEEDGAGDEEAAGAKPAASKAKGKVPKGKKGKK